MLTYPPGLSIFADDLDHPECLCVQSDGTVYAGGEAGQIYRISPDGKTVAEIANTGGFVLGVALSPDSSWLAACDFKNKCVWKLDLSTLALSRWLVEASGQPIAIPNHGAFDFEGNYYVSDSGDAFRPAGRIIKASPDGRAVVWHEGPIAFANGVALGPENDALFVVSSFLPGVERIAIRPDGTAGERTVYTTLPQPCIPDGLAFAQDGTLFVSCYEPSTIYRVDPNGAATPFLGDPHAHGLCHSTNCAFAGPDFSDLLVANLGRRHISRIPAGQPGLRLPCHR